MSGSLSEFSRFISREKENELRERIRMSPLGVTKQLPLTNSFDASKMSKDANN